MSTQDTVPGAAAASLGCEEVGELSGAFALQALDPDQHEAVRQHCLTCDLCAALVREFQATVAWLALTATSANPSPDVKLKLLNRIAAASGAGLQPTVTTTAPLSSYRTQTIPASTADPAAGEVPAPVAPPSSRKRISWGALAAPLATIPLLLALGLVGYWGIHTRSLLADKGAEVAQLSAQVSLLSSQVENYSASFADVDEYIAVDGGEQYAMLPTDANDNASGTIVCPNGAAKAMVMLYNIPPGNEQVRVLAQSWNGDVVELGVVPVDENGDAMALVDLQGSIGSYQQIRVEPMPESDQPDSDTAANEPDILIAQIGPDLADPADTASEHP